MTIRTFFETFEHHSAAARDAESLAALAALYAPSFVVAGRTGVQMVKATDLIQVIPKRKQLLESVGCQFTKLASLQETKLDDRYSMVRTEWMWRFDRGADAPVEIMLPSTFIVHRSDDGLRIVFYLSHEDIVTALRERGLLPALA